MQVSEATGPSLLNVLSASEWKPSQSRTTGHP